MTTDHHSRAPVGDRIALLSILGFWLFYTLINTLRAAVMDFPSPGELALRRGAVTLIGIAVTWLFYRGLRLLEDRPTGQRVAAAFAGALPCALAISLINYWIFLYNPLSLFPDIDVSALRPISSLQIVAEFTLVQYFFLVAWAMLFLALSYARKVRSAERDMRRLERAAQNSELRSLRYQVNPHFLFNTLNSLSSLVMHGRAEQAEAMIMNLSTFYRTSLSSDPLDDVTLAEEVRLQRLYLDIEAVRYPERLSVEIDIPADVLQLCVPGLILQPLVENVIKHAVSLSRERVIVTIAARRVEAAADDMLELSVANAGGGPRMAAPRDAGPGGIGLANVRDRLEARFGAAGTLETSASENGGFRAVLHMPAIAE